MWRPQGVTHFAAFQAKKHHLKRREGVCCVPFSRSELWEKALDVKARQALDPKNWKPATSKLFKHWTLPPVNSQFLVSTNGSAISRAQANLRHNYCREKVRSSSEFYNPVRYQIHYTDLYNLKWKNNDHIIGIIPYFIKTKSYILLTPTWGASFMNRLDLPYTNPPRPPSATSALLPPSRSNAEVNSTKRSMDWQIQWGFPGMGVPQ